MKFNKMMTKVLSALIMVSMVGTSVQVPTLAEVTNAGRAIVAGTVEDKAKDASGSTESKDAGAADDEDNKNQNDAENAEIKLPEVEESDGSRLGALQGA